MNLLEVKNLVFSYGKDLPQILDIQNFSLKRNEKVFLFGPSGCGKTTFLEVLAGVLSPQIGSYHFQEKEMSALNANARDEIRAAHIGYVFQSFNLIPYLNVQENILLPLYLSSARRKKVPQGTEIHEARHLCESLGIVDLFDRTVSELSVGQQQRVAVARALLGSPDLILADEPTSALDQDHRERFIQLLFQACAKTSASVLFVSHDRSLQSLFDRTISLPEINRGPHK